MQKQSFHLKSPEETNAIAAKLALMLKPGDVVALYGDLGTGKTTIARQVIRQLMGVDDNGDQVIVTSPTFNLLQKYSYNPNKKYNLSQEHVKDSSEFDLNLLYRNNNQKYASIIEIFHFDLYRLNHPEEIFDLGIEEAWDNNISIIEWPEIIEAFLPKDTIKIKLSTVSDNTRKCVVYIE